MPHYNGLGIITNLETLKHIGRYAQVICRHYAISFQRCRHFWILVSKEWVSLNQEGTLTDDTIDALDCYFFLLQQILCTCFEFTFICFHLSSSISATLCGLVLLVFSLCPPVWDFTVLVTSLLLWQNTVTESNLEVQWIYLSLKFQRR